MEIGIRKIRETSFIQSSETFHVPPDNPRTVSFWVGKVLTVQLVLRVGIVFEIYINKIKNKLGRSEKDQREVTGSNIFIIGGVLSYHISSGPISGWNDQKIRLRTSFVRLIILSFFLVLSLYLSSFQVPNPVSHVY